MPPFFKNAESFIKEMESSEMCNQIYKGEFAELKDLCATSLNGILNKGLTNAFYHMFAQI